MSGALHVLTGVYSPLFAPGLFLLLTLLAATPLFRPADTPPSPRPRRVATLDGLRGYLALAVVFDHISIYEGYLRNGIWTMPPSRFYTGLGQEGVAVFFMITGYLFWWRLLAENGRLAWLSLYLGRIFRIVPLYLAAVSAMLLTVLASSGPHLRESASQVSREVLCWSAFGIAPGPDVNLYPGTGLVLAGVTWTIRWEWCFYLSLPVLALLARAPRARLPALCIALALLLLFNPHVHREILSGPGQPLALVACFVCGMLTATLLHGGRVPSAAMPDRLSSLLAGFAFVAGLYKPWSVVGVLAPALAFFLVCSGTTIFGLLVSRPARRLGDISYGIYLLQGLLLAAVLRPTALRFFALGSTAHFWALGALGTVLLLVVATASHVWIERPGIALGRRVVRGLQSRRGQTVG